jgi:peptide/nickel transport system permease protein
MAKYLLKRFVILLVILFFVSFGTFFLIHLAPGDPTVTILGSSDTAENRANLLAQLGLNKPIWEQYFIWLGHVLQGNLGTSYIYHEPVATEIRSSFLIDIQLIVLSQLVAFAVAIPLALLSARRPNKIFDRVSTATTFTFLAIPAFAIAPIALLLFTLDTHLLPGIDAYKTGGPFWSNLHALVLPALILTLGSIVVYFRILRTDLISTLQEDFITMAQSKGLSDTRVLLKHAFRPSSLSLLATAGLNIAALIAGTFVVEYLFQINGLGYQLVAAVEASDYISVQGIILVVAVFVLLINFIVDALYAIIDPRVAVSRA